MYRQVPRTLHVVITALLTAQSNRVARQTTRQDGTTSRWNGTRRMQGGLGKRREVQITAEIATSSRRCEEDPVATTAPAKDVDSCARLRLTRNTYQLNTQM